MLSPVVLGTSAGRERDSRARVPKPTAPRWTAASEAPSHGPRVPGGGRPAEAASRAQPCRDQGPAGRPVVVEDGDRRPPPPAPGKESPSQWKEGSVLLFFTECYCHSWAGPGMAGHTRAAH